MDQIRVYGSTKTVANITNTKTLVNIINLDPIKYPGPHQSYTVETVLDVDSTTKA